METGRPESQFRKGTQAGGGKARGNRLAVSRNRAWKKHALTLADRFCKKHHDICGRCCSVWYGLTPVPPRSSGSG